MNTKRALWFGGPGALLLACCVLAAMSNLEAMDAARDSRLNQLACDQFASEILTLRRLNSVAKEGNDNSAIGNAQLVSIARKCAIAERQIRSIQRLSPVAIDQTDYERQDILLDLREVSMQQVLQLVLESERSLGSFKATSLSLTATSSRRRNPGTTPSGESWNVQLILTQLVFVATSKRR